MADPDTLQTIVQQMNEGHYDEAAGMCLSILRQDPGDGPVIALYGRLALQMGRTEDAIIILRKLLALAPDHGGAHEDLALAYNLGGDHGNASAHAQRALELNEQSVEARLVLGTILVSQGKDEEALRYIEEARELTYGDPRVEKIYIDSLLNMGRFPEAHDLLKELIALYPEDSYLYKQFADSHRFTEQDPDLHLVRSLAKAGGELALDGEPADKVHAYMALFKVESDLENGDAAFDYLHKAKTIRKSISPPYDAQAVARRKQQMQQVFDARFFDARGAVGCPSTSPILIIGMPYSGTSILERVVSSHPDVAAGGELPIAGRLLEEACVRFGRNQYDIPALGRMPPEAWRQLGDRYVQLAMQQTGQSTYFTDMRPDNVFLAGFIRAMLPNATLVHLSRHPVANCLSLYEQDLAEISYGNDLTWLGQHYLAYREAVDYWRSLFPDSIVDIEYESLVGDTASTLRILGQALGLEFDAGAIEASQHAGEITTASRWQSLETQLQPLINILAPALPEQGAGN